MAEVEATIPENSETIEEPTVEAASQVQEPAPEPKRGRGRPAGSKDRAPRTTKPKVRAEPIPSREPPAPKRAAPEPSPAPEPTHAMEQRPPSPEPPSPRTLFRQTSAHLLNLRDIMNSQKRASVAERYTSRLHAWPVV